MFSKKNKVITASKDCTVKVWDYSEESLDEDNIKELVEDQKYPTIWVDTYGENEAMILLGDKKGNVTSFDLRKDYPEEMNFNTSLKKVNKYSSAGKFRDLFCVFSDEVGEKITSEGLLVQKYFSERKSRIIFCKWEGEGIVLSRIKS